MSGHAADIGLVARQQNQLLAEFRTMKDDMGVMMAIVMRLDGTVSGLINDTRAIHSQHNRLANRVRALEGAGTDEGLP
jgi:hypothetical protein